MCKQPRREAENSAVPLQTWPWGGLGGRSSVCLREHLEKVPHPGTGLGASRGRGVASLGPAHHEPQETQAGVPSRHGIGRKGPRLTRGSDPPDCSRRASVASAESCRPLGPQTYGTAVPNGRAVPGSSEVNPRTAVGSGLRLDHSAQSGPLGVAFRGKMSSGAPLHPHHVASA